jgi:predicted phosphodiesterase
MEDPAYQRQVAEALDAVCERVTFTPAFDLARDRWIIFSDQHRGARNGADDFLRAERAYNAALAYYFRLGHTLVVLGDAEELWEEYPGPVLRSYPHTFELEARFHQQRRYVRVWGNHDDDWASPDNVARRLAPLFDETLVVHEGVRVAVNEGAQSLGQLFLAHGHQGDTASDQWSQVSRWVVRWFWRPLQRLTHISANTPATDWQLREKHNIALYRWAERQTRTVLIAGHTHRPVFKSRTHAEQIARTLEDLEARLRESPEDKRLQRLAGDMAAELEWVRAQDAQSPGNEGEPVPMSKPCYFNTGCCCFWDGDITGLELAEGDIRLVRWPDRYGRPRPQILASAPLKDVLSQC